jgi:hypothetical protein
LGVKQAAHIGSFDSHMTTRQNAVDKPYISEIASKNKWTKRPNGNTQTHPTHKIGAGVGK